MSNKVKGYLLGILASLALVLLWVIFYVFLNLIAGVIGALMGFVIILIYKKINPEDNDKTIYIVSSIVALFEIFLAEFLSVAIICAQEGVDLNVALINQEVIKGMSIDIAIAIVLSAIVLISYIATMKKKNKAIIEIEERAKRKKQEIEESNSTVDAKEEQSEDKTQE